MIKASGTTRSVRNTEGGISMGIARTNIAARVMRKHHNKTIVVT